MEARKVFVDIGAHVGETVAVALDPIFRMSAVHAIEPSPTAPLSASAIWLCATDLIALPIAFDVQNESVLNCIAMLFMRWTCSNWQLELQPSRLSLLPSSHCSAASRTPLPHGFA